MIRLSGRSRNRWCPPLIEWPEATSLAAEGGVWGGGIRISSSVIFLLVDACVGLNWLLVSFLSHVNKNIIHSFIHSHGVRPSGEGPICPLSRIFFHFGPQNGQFRCTPSVSYTDQTHT